MSFLRHLPSILVVPLVLVTGCGTKDDSNSTNSTPVSEQTAAATSATGVLLESATEQVLSASAGAPAGIPAPGTEFGAPNLINLGAGINKTYDLNTLTLYGKSPFAQAQGTVTVTTTGVNVASWPAASGGIYTGTVTVSYAGVKVVTTDGDSVTLTDATFNYTLEANLVSKTDHFNWEATTQSTLSISPDLAGTVTHGGSVVNFSLGGKRKVDVTITRKKDATTNTRTTKRKIYGDAVGTSVATTSTSTDGHRAASYSGWSISCNGVKVTWNRYAEVDTVLDLAPVKPTATVTSTKDYIYLSTVLLGFPIVSGPMTIQEAGQLVKAQLDANFL